jgi:hypothetical protein
MNVLYYYYYLFYTRVLPDNEPHATVIFTLSFSESLLVNGILDISSAHFFCKKMEMWLMIGIFLMLIAANYLIYSRKKKSRIIVEQRPAFFSSHNVSIIITLLWFIITTSFLFWKPIYVKDILDQCR